MTWVTLRGVSVPPPPVHKEYSESNKIVNENIYVLEIGANLCHKLTQLCFITNPGRSFYELVHFNY